MARKPRQMIESPGVLYHIVCRGNNQQRIFRRAGDYKKLLKTIKDTKKKYPFYLYSHNLLPNHFHLEVETIDFPVSKIMHQINNVYVKYFRKRHGGSGHLFQERFYSSVIDKDSYFWEVACYIDLNAVRAGLVKKPEDYKWSSYSAYYLPEKENTLIDRDKFLEYIEKNLEKARLVYLQFVKEKMEARRKPPFPLNENMV